MSEGSEGHAFAPRVEATREAHAVKPDLRADTLLKEGSILNAGAAERPSPISADGKQIQFADIYAGTQGYGQRDRETTAPTAPAAPDKSVDKASILFSKDATSEQKLATVMELAKSGVTNLNYRDSSGNNQQLRLELEAAGSRQMVHLFVTGADGKENTALRGIARADGTFENERNPSGQFVDYKGHGYAKLMGEQPEVSGDTGDTGPQSRRAVAPQRPYSFASLEVPPLPSSSPSLTGSMDRSQFDAQLRDPGVMAAFAGRMRSEVGTQGPAAQLAFAEEVMNRAASRNQTLMQALHGKYYPTRNPGHSNNPAYIAAITKAWQEGTDTTHGATGNASGKVGFGVRGGHYDAQHHWVSPNQTVRINRERFGYEQKDLNRGWLAKYQQLKESGAVANARRFNRYIG